MSPTCHSLDERKLEETESVHGSLSTQLSSVQTELRQQQQSLSSKEADLQATASRLHKALLTRQQLEEKNQTLSLDNREVRDTF